MLKLPNVTLIALTGKDFQAHDDAIHKSCEGIEWGAVKVVYDYTIKSIDDWNYKVLYELGKYVETEFAMLIHADGYIINPDCWRDEFLEFDYIGAPWPLPQDDYSYRTPSYIHKPGELVRVGNSVSLRSKRILDLPRKLGLEFKPFWGNTNEDGKLCVEWRDTLKQHGVKYAPLEVAKYFSKEHEIEENKGLQTFAFHSL